MENAIQKIYIPIWLDLLCPEMSIENVGFRDLHSNMVRFIIAPEFISICALSTFTFQYG